MNARHVRRALLLAGVENVGCEELQQTRSSLPLGMCGLTNVRVFLSLFPHPTTLML